MKKTDNENALIRVKPIQTNNSAIDLIKEQMDVSEVVKKVSVRTTVETDSQTHTVHQVAYPSGKLATFLGKKDKKK